VVLVNATSRGDTLSTSDAFTLTIDGVSLLFRSKSNTGSSDDADLRISLSSQPHQVTVASSINVVASVRVVRNDGGPQIVVDGGVFLRHTPHAPPQRVLVFFRFETATSSPYPIAESDLCYQTIIEAVWVHQVPYFGQTTSIKKWKNVRIE
jgi:hypothetical protein